MTGKGFTPRQWAFRLGLLWLGVVAASAGLARHLLNLETRLRWEQEVRGEVRKDIAVYRVNDPAAWARHQRQADARIAELERQQSVTRTLFFAVALVGLAAGGRLLWVGRAERPAATK
jgi:hypothetical protein